MDGLLDEVYFHPLFRASIRSPSCWHSPPADCFGGQGLQAAQKPRPCPFRVHFLLLTLGSTHRSSSESVPGVLRSWPSSWRFARPSRPASSTAFLPAVRFRLAPMPRFLVSLFPLARLFFWSPCPLRHRFGPCRHLLVLVLVGVLV